MNVSRPARLVDGNRQGLLVVIDGVDGSGKTTQVKMVCARLLREHFLCVASCEPTKGAWGQKLRRSALEGRLEPNEELEVICNDRMDDVQNCIKPSLAAGKIVVLDRYYTSTLCYQTVRGLTYEMILERNLTFAPPPDIIFILDVGANIAMERIRQRDGAPDKFEDFNLPIIREKFCALKLPGLIHLDADRSAQEIHEEIYGAVVSKFETLTS